LGLALAIAAAAAIGWSGMACQQKLNIHQTDEAKSQPCSSCHDAAYQSTVNPVHSGLLGADCATCHNTNAWSPSDLRPDQHQWFPLQNMHAPASDAHPNGPACTGCHTKSFNKGDTPNDCVGCHQKDYDTAQAPVHKDFPTDCKVCHNDLGWRPSVFVHPWPLLNKHSTTPCGSCHTGSPPKWAGMMTTCVGCHQTDYDGAQNPIHRPLPPTSGMLIAGGRTCEDCHTNGGATAAGGWQPATFVHPTAPFELTGAHADPNQVKCNDCHAAPLPAGTAPRGYDAKTFTWTHCADCHMSGPNSYATSTYPGHQTFSTECRLCHDTTAFVNGTVHPEAKFNLAPPAKHSVVVCTDCHDVTRGASKGGANVSCLGCHGYQSGAWNPTPGFPALDQRHATNGGMSTCAPGQTPGLTAPGTLCFPNPTQVNANSTLCRTCHPLGLK
jgi:hypothetical protein